MISQLGFILLFSFSNGLNNGYKGHNNYSFPNLHQVHFFTQQTQNKRQLLQRFEQLPRRNNFRTLQTIDQKVT